MSDGNQQPLDDHAHKPGPAKGSPYGKSRADKTPEGGKTKYDKPAKAADDFATDEQREKAIRGNEAAKD